MDKYIVIKDWFNIKEGTIIEDTNGKYVHTVDGNTISFNHETLNNEEHFKLYSDPIIISNIDDIEPDDNEYRFRIQLDVKCNKERLKEIEMFLRNNLETII
jgi:hypothetical protein